MWKRNSFVDHIHVYGLLSSSILQIGDSQRVHSESNALAVQREKELFYGNEGDLNQLPLFSKPLIEARPLIHPPQIMKYHVLPNINVRNIKIKGISASAVVQVGNTATANLQSKVMHIRQLTNDRSGDTRKDG
ncbi:spore germination protein GerPE [Lederbergia graminis]|uniref:Spore germination protein GerPE n=1 Tax=Lederbergia graminis TaxID=735518 RepID=A0ABW0LI82_9BACI